MEASTLPQAPRPAHSWNDYCLIPENGSLGFDDRSVQPSLLCAKCEQLPRWLKANLHFVEQKPSKFSEKKFDHHATCRELEEAYQQGCHLCTLVWGSLVDRRSSRADQFRSSGKSVQLIVQHSRWSRLTNGATRMSHVEAKQGSETILVVKAIVEEPRCSVDLNLDLITTGGSLPSEGSLFPLGNNTDITSGLLPYSSSKINAARSWLWQQVSATPEPSSPLNPITYVPTPPISLPLSTLSRSAIKKTINWASNCVDSHAECKSSTDLVPPTRLINLDHIQRHHIVRILPSPPTPNMRYAALSYCWGGAAKICLKKANISNFEAGVAVGDLPKTIQDAIYFTAGLGLQWLWVDSLCIIQDSDEDKAHEIKNMYNTYKNCFVTIAALGATHNDAGLYVERDPLKYARCELARISGGYSIAIDPPMQRKTRQNCPKLLTRGWVMQERIIAPRTVHFGQVVTWECHQGLQKEFYGQINEYQTRQIKSSFLAPVTQPKAGTISNDEEHARIHRAWLDTLSEYSTTDLTFVSDRLNAISAVISAIQERTNWRNVAGLWVPFLFTELLWRDSQSRDSPDHRTGIPPSWSWASLSCAITVFDQPVLQRFASVEVEDEDLDCLKGADGKSNRRPIVLRVSCAPLKLSKSFAHTNVFFEGPSINGKLLHRLNYAPKGEKEMEYFLPFAEVKKIPAEYSIIGLGVRSSSSFPGAFERVLLTEISAMDRESNRKLVSFLHNRKETVYLV